MPGLKEAGISKKSIHNLMMPPRKNTNAAKLYKSLVSARVPKKKNDLKSGHQDLHFCRTQADYVFEAAEMFKDDTLCLLADDKNKINVGTLAVQDITKSPSSSS